MIHPNPNGRFKFLFLASAFCLVGCAATSPVSERPPGASIDRPADLVQFTDDPIEPFNRVSFVVSDGAMDYLLIPLADGYSFIVRRPVRESIRKFGNNLAFPVRLINTLLQWKLEGAGVETSRFVINTTVGVLGFFDPARRWGFEPYAEDFGQTFGKWGMGTGFYLFLPVTGPSSGRDAVGAVGDALANPATYIPGLGIFLRFNDLTFLTDEYQRLVNSQSDPYLVLRELWSVDREKDVIDFVIPPEDYDAPPLVGVASAFLAPRDAGFRRRASTGRAPIPATGRNLPYTIWPNPESRRLVFILPGVGSHRDSGLSHAVAEQVFEAGFTPVTLSSPLNWEFIENAAVSEVPGYPPYDVEDIRHSLASIYAEVNRTAAIPYDEVGVIGLSLGGLHALFLAAEKRHQAGEIDNGPSLPESPPYVSFLAISPPVNPIYALAVLDKLYEAPFAWPEQERDDRIRHTLFKAAAVARGGAAATDALPFTREEAAFLLGLGYRNILQNAIFASQQQHNRETLTNPFIWSRRDALYREIWEFGYADYMERFALEYVREKEPQSILFQTIARAGLRSLGSPYRSQYQAKVVINSDDFILSESDLRWIRKSMGSALLEYETGGHLGGLYEEQTREMIRTMFEDTTVTIKPHRPGRDAGLESSSAGQVGERTE